MTNATLILLGLSVCGHVVQLFYFGKRIEALEADAQVLQRSVKALLSVSQAHNAMLDSLNDGAFP